MPAEARVTAVWKRQKLMVAILVLGMSAWFFFDGVYTYPHSNERWTEFQKFGEKRHAEWLALAEGRHWSPTPPHEFYGPGKIKEQYAFGGVMAFLGVCVLAYWFGQRKTVVRTDAGAVYAPSGKRIPFAAIVSVDKKNWELKGLATVHYQLDGRAGKFVMDDYKYNRKAMYCIMAELEEGLAAAKRG